MQTPSSTPETVAALNADVVNYSRMLADDFAGTSAAMTVARTLVEAAVKAHGGTLANFVGDNFMAVFPSAVKGVHAAIDIASGLDDAAMDVGGGTRFQLRMGMDRGPVSISGGHYEGDALNIAARIQSLARAGGLSVSGAVYRELDEPALRFRPTGAHRLKNIPEEIEIYEFTDLPVDSAAIGSHTDLSLEIPSVAVLPMHTEGVDEDVAATAMVVRADIIHRLASIAELDVVDASEESSGVATRYMLESGLHQFGEQIRLYATVFDVTTMNVVKSHKISTTTSDLFTESERLADQVGESIEVELVVGAPAGLYAELEDPVAIEQVYTGWYHLRSDSKEGWTKAVAMFGKVRDSHPELPYGWVLSAFANWAGASNGWADDSAATFDLAHSQALKGMEVGDLTGMGQAVHAAILMSMGQMDEAVEVLENLEIVRPTCDVTFALEGSLKRYLGRWEEAVGLLDQAMRLTGINKPWYPTVKACSLLVGNQYEQAASTAESVLEYQPGNVEAMIVLAVAQVELGLERRARANLESLRRTHPGLDIDAWLDSNPYSDSDLVDRWKADIASLEPAAG
jgi:adenylate cyclase